MKTGFGKQSKQDAVCRSYFDSTRAQRYIMPPLPGRYIDALVAHGRAHSPGWHVANRSAKSPEPAFSAAPSNRSTRP